MNFNVYISNRKQQSQHGQYKLSRQVQNSQAETEISAICKLFLHYRMLLVMFQTKFTFEKVICNHFGCLCCLVVIGTGVFPRRAEKSPKETSAGFKG